MGGGRAGTSTSARLTATLSQLPVQWPSELDWEFQIPLGISIGIYLFEVVQFSFVEAVMRMCDVWEAQAQARGGCRWLAVLRAESHGVGLLLSAPANVILAWQAMREATEYGACGARGGGVGWGLN